MKKIIALLLLFLVYTLAEARLIQKIKMEQGLSSNYITGITQDRQGIVWVSTICGLNRFDGNKFKVFGKSENNSINGNGLNVVFTDRKDNLIWIGNSRTGLNSFNCRTSKFTSYRYDPKRENGISNDGITDITDDRIGNLWIATYSGGVDHFDKRKERFEHYNTHTVRGLVSNMCWHVCDDQHGNLYVAHVSDGMSVINIRNKTAHNYRNNIDDPGSIPDNNVSVIYKDSYNNIWVGTKNGLALFNPNDGKFIVFRSIPGDENSLSSNFIRCIDETSDKKLLIGTEKGGLNILDLKQLLFSKSIYHAHFERVTAGYKSNQLSHSNVNCIYHDCFDNVWVGTDGGINFYSKNELSFQLYTYNPIIDNRNSLSHPVVPSLCVDGTNSLWIATYGGGVDVFQDNVKTNHFDHSNSVISDFAISSFCDSENNIWIGCSDGKIYRSEYRSGKFQDLSALFNSKGTEINCFFEDKNKNILIGTNNGLLTYNIHNRYITRKIINAYDDVGNMIHAISLDKEGNIWIGTLKGQISIYDKNFVKIRMLGTTSTACVNHLYCDSKMRMWVATGENIYMVRNWDALKCDTFDIKQGLLNTSINSIIEDNNNMMWIGTNSGICCLNPHNKSFVNYTAYDGIPVADFKVGSVAKSSRGIVYFGSDNGVCYFNPNEITQGRATPTATITDFAVDHIENSNSFNQEYYSTLMPVSLAYNQNTFTISYNVPDYSYNNQIEFSYMLEGLANEWYNTSISKQITFRNLPPGNYTFHLRSRYKNQKWQESSKTLIIVIHPPFWLSWWAKTIYGLLILALGIYVVGFYKRRLRLENSLFLEKQHNLQQQDLNNERLRFFTNITHELRTPLTLIIGPLEDLLNDNTIHEQYLRKINIIHKSASRLLDLVNQILEFRKTETQNRSLNVQHSDLSNQIHEITLKYEELNRNKNLVIQCIVEPGDYEFEYDPEVISIIIDNLISNALKYTQNGSITLSLCTQVENNSSYVVIGITDTGCGIAEDALPHIFDRYYQANGKFQAAGSGIGLSIVKKLVELHHADIKVESEEGVGTAFYIKLVRDNIYSEIKETVIKENDYYVSESNSNPILLIVEDNQDIQAYISDIFLDSFHVITANNGQEGLDTALVKVPDIIISDIMMPIMDGFELCHRIKEDVKTSHIPFILLTAKNSNQDKTNGYTVGADSYITKPFSANLLTTRVFNLLESRKKIAVQFANSIFSKAENVNEAFNKLDKEFIDKLTEYIEENIEYDEINIPKLTDKMFMSRSTLYRKVKALTGFSINEFIRKIKMRKAEELLVSGQYSLAEIMSRVGISSPTYFRKCFRDEYKVNPSDYIRIKK